MKRKRGVESLWVSLWGVLLLIGIHHIAQATPLAVMTESTFSFGSVVEGTQIEHDFVLKNNGADPLIIEKIVPG
jgi:hypothetical protein